MRQKVTRIRPSDGVTDVEFDQIYPDWVRQLSDLHWTPIEVARRAAHLLARDSRSRILDVGSGVGKFCLVGALTTRASFVGIEQRDNLVEIARDTARRCGDTRTRFVHGNALEMDWGEFDGFYLFNPFYEQVSTAFSPLDATIEYSTDRFTQYITGTYVKLFSAPIGARVVTYHGYGGAMPGGFRLLLHEVAGSDYLELWEKETVSTVE